MSVLLPVSRTCVRQTLPSIARPTVSLQPSQLHLRNLTTGTQSQAQPVDLSSATLPASPSESSTLASSVLSRATTDSEANSQIPKPSPKQSSSIPESISLPKSSPKPDSQPPTTHFATVTRTGTMLGAVQLTARVSVRDKVLHKNYTRSRRLLAYDPNPAGFLRVGDVVQYSAMDEAELAARDKKRQGIRETLVKAGKVSYITKRGKVRPLNEVGLSFGGPEAVVRKVITPFGVGIEERTKV